MTGTDEKPKPMLALPHVQTVSTVDMTREEVEDSIPLSAGTVQVEAHDELIVVKSEYEFKLKPSKSSAKEDPVAEVQNESTTKKND